MSWRRSCRDKRERVRYGASWAPATSRLDRRKASFERDYLLGLRESGWGNGWRVLRRSYQGTGGSGWATRCLFGFLDFDGFLETRAGQPSSIPFAKCSSGRYCLKQHLTNNKPSATVVVQAVQRQNSPRRFDLQGPGRMENRGTRNQSTDLL